MSAAAGPAADRRLFGPAEQALHEAQHLAHRRQGDVGLRRRMRRTARQHFGPAALAQEAQKVAVPAWGLSCWSVRPISMDWPALWNLLFPAIVWWTGRMPDDRVVFIYHQSVSDRWPFFNCIVTGVEYLRHRLNRPGPLQQRLTGICGEHFPPCPGRPRI